VTRSRIVETVVMDRSRRGAGGKDLRPVLRLVNAKGKEVCFANTDIRDLRAPRARW